MLRAVCRLQLRDSYCRYHETCLRRVPGLERRRGVGDAQRASAMLLPVATRGGRVVALEHVPDERLGADELHVVLGGGDGERVRIAGRLAGLGVEVTLDAVVDEDDQARGDDDTATRC